MFGRLLILTLCAVVAWAIFAGGSTGAGRPQTYVVQPYDTLWAIASEHYAGDPRAAIAKIGERNGIQDGLLVPGQKLVLP